MRRYGIEAPEQIILDVNLLGEGKDYIDVSGIAVSPDHTRLTYRFQGRDYRLTDVHGHVIKQVLA